MISIEYSGETTRNWHIQAYYQVSSIVPFKLHRIIFLIRYCFCRLCKIIMTIQSSAFAKRDRHNQCALRVIKANAPESSSAKGRNRTRKTLCFFQELWILLLSEMAPGIDGNNIARKKQGNKKKGRAAQERKGKKRVAAFLDGSEKEGKRPNLEVSREKHYEKQWACARCFS